jgi:hypothetical protein
MGLRAGLRAPFAGSNDLDEAFVEAFSAVQRGLATLVAMVISEKLGWKEKQHHRYRHRRKKRKKE